ncbi:MAG TPA: hypothetical protein VM938_05690 [Acidimicrobiales bacterium]|nr:hypothetical protein [Acidimicrobiales bacterium]
MTVLLAPGEELLVPERVIVAPALGVFQPLAPEVVTTEGEIVEAGQSIGTVTVGGEPVHIRSPFRGFLMGMLAVSGERVRESQPVAWLRTL